MREIEVMIRDFCTKTGSRVEFDHEANLGDGTPVTVTNGDLSVEVNFGKDVWDRADAWEMFFLLAREQFGLPSK